MAKKLKEIGGEVPTNGAQSAIEDGLPYTVTVRIQGSSDLIFHRWNCEEVDAKSNAPKGSDTKKKDNLEAMVYRDDEGNLCLPGEYLRMSIINAAKYRKDPRSPRKSAMDIFKAAVVVLTNLASLGKEKWDYEDKRRAVIQRAGINRTRPAMKVGWEAEFDIMCNLPEYIDPQYLNEVIQMAGRLVGVGDQRPSYGRFIVTKFEVNPC